MIAYLLVVHGSRNISYHQQWQKLQELIIQNLYNQKLSTLLATAYLELGNKPLSLTIIDFAKKCVEKNYQTLKILPLFLFSGTHVLQDIPEEVEIARLSSPMDIQLMSHLGQSKDLISLLRKKYQEFPNSHRILLSHGTSIIEGNQEAEAIAIRLSAQIAYWSISPSLTTSIKNLANNAESIAILPYFLFRGKITETLTDQISLLQKNTNTKLIFLSPLGATYELAKVIVEELKLMTSPRM